SAAGPVAVGRRRHRCHNAHSRRHHQCRAEGADWQRCGPQWMRNVNRRRPRNGVVNQRPYSRRARGVLPKPGTERAITPGDCRRDGSLAPIHPEGGGERRPSHPEDGAHPACRCLPAYVLCGRRRGVRILSAYLPPFCGVCLVRVKKKESSGFIVPLITTETFSASSSTSLNMNI